MAGLTMTQAYKRQPERRRLRPSWPWRRRAPGHLLAGHGLLRVVGRRALGKAGGIEEAGDAIRRLGALGEPGLDLLDVELDAVGESLGSSGL
jgi:hypothetical protein